MKIIFNIIAIAGSLASIVAIIIVIIKNFKKYWSGLSFYGLWIARFKLPKSFQSEAKFLYDNIEIKNLMIISFVIINELPNSITEADLKISEKYPFIEFCELTKIVGVSWDKNKYSNISPCFHIDKNRVEISYKLLNSNDGFQFDIWCDAQKFQGVKVGGYVKDVNEIKLRQRGVGRSLPNIPENFKRFYRKVIIATMSLPILYAFIVNTWVTLKIEVLGIPILIIFFFGCILLIGSNFLQSFIQSYEDKKLEPFIQQFSSDELRPIKFF